MATSSITDNVVLSLDATKKLAEMLRSDPEPDNLRRFTKEERAEMDRRKENVLEIIRAKTMKAAGDSE